MAGGPTPWLGFRSPPPTPALLWRLPSRHAPLHLPHGRSCSSSASGRTRAGCRPSPASPPMATRTTLWKIHHAKVAMGLDGGQIEQIQGPPMPLKFSIQSQGKDKRQQQQHHQAAAAGFIPWVQQRKEDHDYDSMEFELPQHQGMAWELSCAAVALGRELSGPAV